MILKATQLGSDANNANDYFDALRQKSYEASFDGVKEFIVENKDKLRHRRHKKPLRKWQWMLAVLLPVLVGQTISFSVPEGGDATRQALEPIVDGLQTVVSPDRQKPGYLSYTSFIPAQSSRSADAVFTQLKGVKGITGLSIVPVNAQVRESLLSQLGSKIFRTHVDATGLGDDELQNTVNRQLKEKGFNNISVTVIRNENGIRTLQLHPTEDASNYIIDMSMNDKGTRMVLQEERRTNTDKPKTGEGPNVDFGSMNDAQVRDHIRRQYGTQLVDENIKIIRTAEEITIEIKQSDKREENLRFKLN